MSFHPNIIRISVYYLVKKVERLENIKIPKYLSNIMGFLAYNTLAQGKRLAYCTFRIGQKRVRLYQYIENLDFNYDILLDHCYDQVFPIYEDDIVIDVGAHVGIFTIYASFKAKKGCVLSFEPHPLNFKLLELNIKLNNIYNVILFKRALHSIEGTARLFLHDRPGGHSIILRRSRKSIVVAVTTLEKVFKKLGIYPGKIFLKVNAEGAEVHVLKGALGILLKAEDCRVVISCDHYPEEPLDIWRMLTGKGFEVFYDIKRRIIYGRRVKSR